MGFLCGDFAEEIERGCGGEDLAEGRFHSGFDKGFDGLEGGGLLANEGGLDGGADLEGCFAGDVFLEEVFEHGGHRFFEVRLGEDFVADDVGEEVEGVSSNAGSRAVGLFSVGVSLFEEGVDFGVEVLENEFPGGGLFAPFGLVDIFQSTGRSIIVA